MKLKKELVDEVIRLTKKYYKAGEVDILPALREAEDALSQKGKVSHQVTNLIGDLAKFTQRSGKGTYKDIYKVLAIFGEELEGYSGKKDPVQPATKPSKPMGRRKMNGEFEYDSR